MRGLVLVLIALLAFACKGGGEGPPAATSGPSPPVITPTPQPTYPPKVSLIERGVYLIRPGGTDLRHLTPGQEGLYYFRWSPDGSRIAVVTSTCNAPRVSVIDVDSGGVLEVAAFDGSAWGHEWMVWGVQWSPDGRQLAVPARRYEEGAPYQTYLVNADGSGEPVELFEGFPLDWSPDGESLAFSAQSDEGDALNIFDMATHETTVTDRGWSLGWLAWSPDGQRMAYSIARASTTEQVVVTDRDGGNRKIIGPGGSRPAWSPDGTRVAFSLGVGPSAWVAVAPADGSAEYIRLAPGEVFRWSPKGDTIAVLHRGDSGSSLSLVSLATGQAIELAGDILPATSLSFSPDGERLAFQGQDPLEEAYDGALYVVNADGTGLQKLVRPSTAIGARVEWSPDGRYIAFVDTVITSCP